MDLCLLAGPSEKGTGGRLELLGLGEGFPSVCLFCSLGGAVCSSLIFLLHQVPPLAHYLCQFSLFLQSIRTNQIL